MILRPEVAAKEKPARVKEADIVAQIRAMLRMLGIPHWKNWGGPMGERGVPDLIGTIPPSGRLLLIEVKTPAGTTSPEQEAFLARYEASGALAMVARGSEDVAKALAVAGYEPARQVCAVLPKATPQGETNA